MRNQTTDVYLDEHTIGNNGGFFEPAGDFNVDPRVREIMVSAEQHYHDSKHRQQNMDCYHAR